MRIDVEKPHRPTRMFCIRGKRSGYEQLNANQLNANLRVAGFDGTDNLLVAVGFTLTGALCRATMLPLLLARLTMPTFQLLLLLVTGCGVRNVVWDCFAAIFRLVVHIHPL